ncbi:MAG: S8 family serine peptidase [Planctomycetes bacterium]|nr:S8 family serine peptidase [Planctomycetota bacterium]
MRSRTTWRRVLRLLLGAMSVVALTGSLAAQDAPRTSTPEPACTIETNSLHEGIDGGVGSSVPLLQWDTHVPAPVPSVVRAADTGDVLVQTGGGNPNFIGFAAGSYFPSDGERLDPDVARFLQNVPRSNRPTNEIYVFVMAEHRMAPSFVDELESMGVRILGFQPHNALAVAVPEERVLDLAYHPEVHWIGFARPWQKVHPYLEQTLQATQSGDVLDVVVTTFESDRNERSVARSFVPSSLSEVAPGGIVIERNDEELLPRMWSSNGWQEAALRELGITVDAYQDVPPGFRCRLQLDQLDRLLAQDFVRFVELQIPDRSTHDESIQMIGGDAGRANYPGNTSAVAILGIIDSGVETGSGSSPAHYALDHTYGVGWDLVGSTSVWDDDCGHGSHVAGTMWASPPAGSTDQTGMAPRLGSSATLRIRAVKIFPGTVYGSCGSATSTHTARYSPMRSSYTDGSGNVSAKPHAINNSWGADPGSSAWIGTESECVTLDNEVWDYEQLYCFSAGNAGSASGSIGRPAVAKNAFAVGSVIDYNSSTQGLPGNIATSSSRGPAGDDRWKPNVSAPGSTIRSVDSRTGTNQNLYIEKSGTSMASPHVTGLVGQLVDHHAWMRYQPHRIAAHLMATASTKGNISLSSPTSSHLDTYGAGRVNGQRAHYGETDWGWTNWGFTQSSSWHYADFTVPTNCTRLVVCMTYHEPPALTGASRALVKDIDLWIDRDPIDPAGNTGEYFAQQSSVDNTEIRHIVNPAAGAWRWKTYPNTPLFAARVSVTVFMVTSNQAPTIAQSLSLSDAYVQPNEHVTVRSLIAPTDYMATDVFLDSSVTTSGITLHGATSTLADGLVVDLIDNPHNGYDVTLGVVEDDATRSVDWEASWSTEGVKSWSVAASSDNAGTDTDSTTITVDGTAPPLPTSLHSTSHTLNGWSNAASITFAWTQPADNLSGVDGYGEHLTTGTPGPSAVIDFSAATSRTVTVTTDGQWNYGLRAVDRSGNWSSTTSNGWYGVDRVLPSLATNLRSTSHTVGAWSTDPTVDFAWSTATDDRSGVDGYGESWGTSSPVYVANVKDMEQTVTTRTMTWSSSAAGWFYALNTVDNAGNWTTGTTEVGPYFIDTVLPSGPTGLTSTTHTPGSTWSSNATVILAWTPATDVHSGLLGYDTLWDHAPSTVLTGALDTGPGATGRTTTLGSSSSPWYFHIAPRDVAGNFGVTQHIGPFLIDSTAPSASLLIDGGAATTTSLGVTLTITGADAQSSLRDMRFRNDGGSWSAWEAFATSKAWALNANGGSSGTGTRRVEVEVRNQALLTRLASDTIYRFTPVSYFGSPCTGLMGAPGFVVNGVPGLARTVTFQVSNTAATTEILFLGASNTNYLGIPLPFDLSVIGAFGCFAYVSLDINFYAGPIAPVPVVIPNDTALVGVPTYQQAWLLGDPGGKLFVTTRGSRVILSGL